MYINTYLCALWLFNIAMENDPFIDGLPIKKMIFDGKLLSNQMVPPTIHWKILETNHHCKSTILPD
jgi:hypothetical protein